MELLHKFAAMEPCKERLEVEHEDDKIFCDWYTLDVFLQDQLIEKVCLSN